MLRLASLILCIAAAAVSAEAAVHNAADCTKATIQTLHDSGTVADTGDTIALPTCTVAWGNNTLTITKCIVLQGNGETNTIIQDTRTSTLITILVVYDVPAGCTTARITGIRWIWTTASAFCVDLPCSAYYLGPIGLNDGRTLRVDHNRFDCNGVAEADMPGRYSASVFYTDTIVGVFDHNTVIGCRTAWLGFVKGNRWNTGVNNHGFESMADDDLFGTGESWYIEDNTLTLSSSMSHLTMIDAQAGGRYVARYNAVTQGSFESHGNDAGVERSGRTFEIYNNTFTGIDVQVIPTYFRGGTGVVYNNGIYGYTATPQMLFLNNKSADSGLGHPFGSMDGRNPWAVNDAGNPFETGTCDSVASLTCTDTGRSFANYAGYQFRMTSGNACSPSVARSADTVTVTCNGHGYSNDDIVGLWGTDQKAYEGVWRIQNVTANTFQFGISTFTPDSPATGTIKIRLGGHSTEIVSNTATAITLRASALGDDYRVIPVTGDTFEINKVTHDMDQVGRVGGTLVASVTNPVPPMGWNDQTTSPWYEWGNLKCPSSPPTVGCAMGTDIDFTSSHAVIVIGTHAINDTEKPGYTAYTYPHPLIDGSDGTPPVPGNSGTITTASITSSSLTLNWTKATDAVSAQGTLQYEVRRSLLDNMDDVTEAEANGTVITAYTTDIATANATSLSPSTTYYFNVIVKDEAGNKQVYTTKSETTAAASGGTVSRGRIRVQ